MNSVPFLFIGRGTIEILRILRNYIIDNQLLSISDTEMFSIILDNTESKCQSNDLHYDQYKARCIDLEGRNLF